MKVRSTDFRMEEGDQVKLDKWPTAIEPIYESKKQYQKLLKKHVDELSSLQQLLYASSRYALLLIFQAMDAAGKERRNQARDVWCQSARLPGVQL
jgi:polyphosphate kinase 2 (PPK2 family)